MTIDLISGRMQKRTLGAMPLEHERGGKVRKAELANVQHVQVGILSWIGTEVPRLELVFAHLQTIQVLHASNLGYGLCH